MDLRTLATPSTAARANVRLIGQGPAPAFAGYEVSLGDIDMKLSAALSLSGYSTKETWPELAAVTGTPNAWAIIPSHAGTHVDPIVGGAPVLNTGVYKWNVAPPGWKRMFDTQALAAQLAVAEAEAVLSDPAFVLVSGDLALGGASKIGAVSTNIAAVNNASANMAAIIAAPTQAAAAADSATTATTQAGIAAGYAGGMANVLPINRLPSEVVSAYWTDTSAPGMVFKNLVTGAADMDLSAVAGLSFTKDGNLLLTNTTIRPPSVTNHQCVVLIVRTPEAGSGPASYIVANSANRLVGPGGTSGGTYIAGVRMLSGPGIRTVPFRADGAAGKDFISGGGFDMFAVNYVSAATGQICIGGSTTGSAKMATLELVGFFICNGQLTDVKLRRILNYARPYCRQKGVFLTADDCPIKKVLVVATGESTDTGTYYAATTAGFNGTVMTVNNGVTTKGLFAANQQISGSGLPVGLYITSLGTWDGVSLSGGTVNLSQNVGVLGQRQVTSSGLPTSSINQFPRLMILSVDNPSQSTGGRYMKRFSLRPGFLNNVAPNVLTLAIKHGWEVGLRDAIDRGTDDGREWEMLKVCNGSTRLLPGGDGTTTSTNQPNAVGGTTAVTSGTSRNPETEKIGGMIWNTEYRNFIKNETQARGRGVGYTSIFFVTNEGINDAYLGTDAVTSAAMYQAMVAAKRAWITTYYGILAPEQIYIKPKQPTGVPGGVLGTDPDYPNDATGTKRLNACNFIRTAIEDQKTAVGASMSVLDGNSFQLDGPTDWTHPSSYGFIQMGGSIYDTIIPRLPVPLVPAA
jgi:hypothetical protein